LTTKLFEYLAARRPVVAEITQRSLVAQYIKQSGLGVVVSEKTEDILHGLQSLRADAFKPNIDDLFIKSLSRQVKATELEQLLARLVSKTGETTV
jgi:hypothetical protein